MKLSWPYIFIGAALLIMALVPVVMQIPEDTHSLSADTLSGVEIKSKPVALEPKTAKQLASVTKTLPAPAKKLTKIINEPSEKAPDDVLLDQKILQLDQRLADFNKQLKEQGIVIADEKAIDKKPDIEKPSEEGAEASSDNSNSSNKDMQARLKVIQEHIKNKNQ